MDDFPETDNVMKRGSKIRRLGKDTCAASASTKSECSLCWKIAFTFKTIGVILTAIFVMAAVSHLRDDKVYIQNQLNTFLSNYNKHYYHILHGKTNYCDPKIDINTLFKRIYQQQILHQGRALQRLKIILRNETNFNSIALVGPSGVGKSMFAQALQQYFPWEENVHSYLWNTYVSDESEKFRMVRLFIESLSDCGRNLLIFDNLNPCDKELVSIVNRIIKAGTEGQDYSKKRIIILYIFRLNTMDFDADMYDKHFEELQNLPNTVTVNFRPFGYEELEDCIRREMAIENLAISDCNFKEIMTTIDPKRCGCKTVYAKVQAYGNPHPTS